MNPWLNPPTLVGACVRLEPLQREHADGLRLATVDGELWKIGYTSVPAPDAVAGYIDVALAKLAAGCQLPFAVRDASGQVVGSTRFYDLEPDVPRLQIGYTWYARRAQRSGLNTQAKLLLLGHAFETMGCACVGFETSAMNEVSQVAIARLGARRDGVLRNHRRHADGSLGDTVAFSIIDSEWPAVKRHLQSKLESHA